MRSRMGGPLRFEARADGLTHYYRVWDLVTDKPVSDQTYTEHDAYQTAAGLDCQYNDTGPRDPSTVRLVDPPKAVVVRVIAQRWLDAILLRWLHEPDGWHGLIRLNHTPNTLGWWPADRIRLPGTEYD